MKTLILHAGLHKTGSTAIQGLLGKSQAALCKYGYEYPTFINPDGVAETNHSHMLQLAFKKHPSNAAVVRKKGWDPEAAARSYTRQLKQAVKNAQNLILSGEGIAVLDINELKALKAFFSGWDIHVVAYVRPAYSYFCSALQERIKNGTLNSVLPATIGRSESDTISQLKTVFKTVQFVSFPEACKHRDGPVGDFFERFGLPGEPAHNKLKSNLGLGNIVTRLCAHLNSHFPKKVEGNRLFFPAKFQSTSLAVKESRFLLMDKEIAEFRAVLDQENNILYKQTGLDFRGEVMKTATPSQLSIGVSFSLAWKLMKQSGAVRREVFRF